MEAVPSSSIVALISSTLAASGLTSGGTLLLQLSVAQMTANDSFPQKNRWFVRDGWVAVYVRSIHFSDRVVINGMPMTAGKVKANEFVKGVVMMR